MILDSCDIPVVLAPLAGGPSTPELAAAVSNAGGLGFLAAGYLSAAELAGRRRRLAEVTSQPVRVNVFVSRAGRRPGPGAPVRGGNRAGRVRCRGTAGGAAARRRRLGRQGRVPDGRS